MVPFHADDARVPPTPQEFLFAPDLHKSGNHPFIAPGMAHVFLVGRTTQAIPYPTKTPLRWPPSSVPPIPDLKAYRTPKLRGGAKFLPPATYRRHDKDDGFLYEKEILFSLPC